MEFLESTNFFVRVVLFDFANRNQNIKLKFRLIPMIHIGSEDYYKKVLQYINECDAIIYEGNQSTKTAKTTKQYKSIANKLDLVVQNEYLTKKAIRPTLIHADYTKETGEQEWQKLKLSEKLKLKYLTPIQFYLEKQTITRHKLAKQYMQSSIEANLAYGPREDEVGTSRNFIMNAREQIVFTTLKDTLEKNATSEQLIGIVYGAGHMKKIARYLIDELGYTTQKGTFVRVFDLVTMQK